MNVLIYGNARENEFIINHMKGEASMAFRLLDFTQTDEYDAFIQHLNQDEYDMVFVNTDNAAGMEGVIAVKSLYPQTPVIWFSNDKNFVAQSYRLGVNYFSVKPIEERVLRMAIERCQRREEYA